MGISPLATGKAGVPTIQPETATPSNTGIFKANEYLQGVNSMVPVPENAKYIDEKVVIYKSDYKGETYVNIRKVYPDKESGEMAIGKGLTINMGQWEKFAKFVKSGDLLKHE